MSTIDDAAELVLKAPNRHKKRLEMLEKMPKGGRCAEIGVWNGAFSTFILKVTQPSLLILIDPWELLSERPKEEVTHKMHNDHQFMGSMHAHVVDKFANSPEVVFKQGFSADMLATIDDNFLDWVYIDGNHRYEFVLKDLQLSARKVRLGGMIAGDDLFWKRDGRKHVQDAVFDFLQLAGLPRKVDKIGQQFMIPVTEELKSFYL